MANINQRSKPCVYLGGGVSIPFFDTACLGFCYPPVSSRLEMLMGSNIVRLTDRKYMRKLMSRIRQNYESQQEVRVQERKMHELMRTKKLILNGFMSIHEAPLEIHQYPLFQLYFCCDSIIGQRRRKHLFKKVKISKSLYQLLYTQQVDEVTESEEEEEEIPMREVVIDGVSQMVPLTPQEIEERLREKDMEEDIRNGYMFTKEEYDNLHYEADAVKKLKETRTVDEMYKKAHEIVGALVSLSGTEKRRRCRRDEEMVEAGKIYEKNEIASKTSASKMSQSKASATKDSTSKSVMK